MKMTPPTAFARSTAATPALPTRRVLGLPVVDATTQDCITALLGGAARTVFFLNAHCANIRARDPQYAAALARAGAVLPDGASAWSWPPA